MSAYTPLGQTIAFTNLRPMEPARLGVWHRRGRPRCAPSVQVVVYAPQDRPTSEVKADGIPVWLEGCQAEAPRPLHAG